MPSKVDDVYGRCLEMGANVHFRDGERDIAVFIREGRTCVLSGEVLDRLTLVKLAAWNADGAVEF